MPRTPLPTFWQLRVVEPAENVPVALRDRAIPATVPGTVHTDLLASELIPDPYYAQNEQEVQWVGENDWAYSCAFEVTEDQLKHEHLELVCEGLDTVAEISVNGQPLAQTMNMHIGYRFNCKSCVRVGLNELTIIFRSALRYAEGHRDRLGNLPNAYPTPFNFIRKMACNYGWDWGPTLITAGIWQPIYLDAWSGAHIDSVRPLVTHADAARAIVDVHVEAAGSTDRTNITCRLKGPGGEVVAERTVQTDGMRSTLTLELDAPELWWPRGHGEQPLYTLAVTLSKDSETLDARSQRLGMRSVKLNTGIDDTGSQFTLAINGKPIFCKGANWIPDDCFPTRVTKERYRQRLEQACDANMNMIRVWGGGIYETDAFYDLCDELGLLVWQDFLFACAAYPEEAPFWDEVEAEARYQVTRLSSHPSLVLWNGNNENIWGFFDWGWQRHLSGRTWGKGYYLDLLPSIVAELDPSRPYWPGSPYSGSMEVHPNDDRHGPKHIWDAWNEKDYTVYRNYQPRFVSEFGFQAPPTFATLQRVIPADELAPESPSMLHHQKAFSGNEKLHKRLAEHFEIPTEFDLWHYATQVNQARALQLGVEWFRFLQPRCMGVIYWQLNDCWPVTSWAAVDGDGRQKPLWYATRHFYAPRLLTIQPHNGTLALFASNDSDAPWNDEATVTRQDFHGKVLAEQALTFSVPPRTTLLVQELDSSVSQAKQAVRELIAARAARLTATWFFERDKDLAYPEAKFSSSLERNGTTYRLTLTAETLLRDVCLYVDRLDPDATINDQFITLLPGDTFTFEIISHQELAREDLVCAPVLQTANVFSAKSLTSKV
jgi:beta-mannosidase